MITIKKVLIPYWVEKTFQRNNVDISAILDYSQVKPLLSIEDMLTLSLVQHLCNSKELSTLNLEYLRGELFTCWDKTATEEDKIGIAALFKLEQEYSNNPYKYLIDRLTAINQFDNLFSTPAEEQDYKIIDLERDTLGIVLYPGFLTNYSNKESRSKFLKDLTKRHYVYMSVPNVSSESFFKAYLETLAP